MRKYQLLYIVSSAINEEQREDVIKKVESIITKNGGVIEGTEKSGMKKFAYPINYRSEGFYVLVNFTAEDKAPNVIAKTLNITDNIVRQMILQRIIICILHLSLYLTFT